MTWYNEKQWFQITYRGLCFGVCVQRTQVIDAAPVGCWMVGKRWSVVYNNFWLKKRGAKIEKLNV